MFVADLYEGFSVENMHPASTSRGSTLKRWVKKLGFWGFLFFLVKGLLWLTIPALIAFFAAN